MDMEELSVSGEYVRARIKGIPYEPIDRTPKEEFTELVWDFNDGSVQGFGINGDSPLQDVVLTNENNTLKISNLSASSDVSEGIIGQTFVFLQMKRVKDQIFMVQKLLVWMLL